TRRTGGRRAGSPFPRTGAPSPGSLSARLSARRKSSCPPPSWAYNAPVLVRTVSAIDVTRPARAVSTFLGGLRRRSQALHEQAVGAEDQEGSPDAGQDRPRDLDRDQGTDHRPNHSPTSHPRCRHDQHVATPEV